MKSVKKGIRRVKDDEVIIMNHPRSFVSAATRVFWQEADVAPVSFVLDMRIWYVGDSGPVEEMIDVSPEVEQHIVRGIPAHVSLVSVESQ